MDLYIYQWTKAPFCLTVTSNYHTKGQKKKKKKKKTDILLPHRDLPPAASFSEPPCEMGTEQS
jgi:hypothetical protein